jgi:vacuolar-type H+-ATPase subunit E/Vma4
MEGWSGPMKYDHLIKAIEDGAEEKIKNITDRADRDILDIKGQAQIESEQFRKDLLADTGKRIAIETNKKIYAAREQVKDRLSQGRQESFREVFQKSALILSSLRTSPTYEVFFSSVLSEITESLDSEKIRLHIDKRDEELCKRLTKSIAKEFEIVKDLITNGGLNGETPDGKVIIRNTIEERLVRAEELLRPVVFSGLYGGQDVR